VSVVEALARAHVQGAAVDWAAVLGPAARVDLPTYAFWRQRFWVAGGLGGRVEELGLAGAGHALLGAVVELPGSGGVVLAGRLSRAGQSWLGDHVIGGRVVVPGAALAEMAVRAGDVAGCGRVEELVVEVPLVVPARGGVQVRVAVGGEGEGGRRELVVYSRGEGGGGLWVRHAAGVVGPGGGGGVDAGLGVWPPAGAVAVDAGGFYAGLERLGYGYGPVFRGVRAVWRRGEELFAEVALPEGTPVAGFGVHPALLDAALHVLVAGGAGGECLVPFAWGEVAVHAVGAVAARVRVAPVAGGGWSVWLADGGGVVVASVGSVVLRALPSAGREVAGESLLRVEWAGVEAGVEGGGGPVAVVGAAAGLGVAGAVCYRDLGELAGSGAGVAGVVVACCGRGDGLGLVQEWLGGEVFSGSRLVVVTERAVDAGGGCPVDVGAAAVWGLVRVAASEHPGRLVLADVDVVAGSGDLVVAGAGLGEREFAVRGGRLVVPRLVRAGGGLVVPADGGWRLGVGERGTVEGGLRVEAVGAGRALGAGEVRVGVRAAGVNFRDVLNVLGMYPGDAGVPGLEGAGVVLEAGPGAGGLVAGDVVMGLFTGAFGPVAVTDARLVARVPAGWSVAEAAAAPVAFLTAWYALVELAGLRAGESVLIHAAAGGVGMAAVQVARYLGAEVFATASPGKWPAVAALGVAADHLASSRSTQFEEAFGAVSGGRGVDVVLDSLAGEFVDASLRLVAAGGRFIEMGKADVRDPAQVAAGFGVGYQAFDLLAVGVDVIGGMLGGLGALFAGGVLGPLPVACWDARRAVDAFRFVSQARHTGKVVLTIPAPPGAGAVLVTGGTGALGALAAGHLAGQGMRELVLVSRRGPGAAGAAAAAAGLAGAGARVRVVSCDAGDRGQLAAVVAAAGPLTGVVHAAGVLDDAVTGSLTPARMRAVMGPKAEAAWHLHELTQDLDLRFFVLFSSVAGIWGSPGQGNYAAASTFLDALAAFRRGLGLPATSLAWGPWPAAGGMTSELTEADWGRMRRQGLAPLADAEGLALLDAAAGAGEALLVAARLDLAGAAGGDGGLPPLLSALAARPATARRQAAGPAGAGSGLAARLAGLPPAEQDQAVREVVLTHAALVLGLAGPEAADGGRSFRELGFDSLTGVELRNRLNTATGLRLPATAVFDYPTPDTLAKYIGTELVGLPAEETTTTLQVFSGLEKIESSLPELIDDDAARARVTTRLKRILSALSTADDAEDSSLTEKIQSASDDDVFDFIDNQLGI
jgi:polyketide synthase 12